MTASRVQNIVAPPQVVAGKNISDAQVKTKTKAIDGANGDTKVDFRDLLSGSNSEAKAIKEAKKNGDLSGAKSEDEFFQRLETQAKPLRVPKNTLDKDDFLKLFVTQLQYQDPSQPKDSSEMASQLAQFNGLEQMMNINKGIEKLGKTQGLSRSLELVGYIGKEVTVPKGKFRVEGQGAVNAATFNCKLPINETMLLVRDSSGAAIAEVELGNFKAGEHKVEWDGKKKDGGQASAGVYNFEISTKGPQGEPVPVEITTRVKITGIDLANEGSFESEIGKLTVDDIRTVSLPGLKSASVGSEAANPVPPQTAVTEGAAPALGGPSAGNGQLPPEILAAMQKQGLPPGLSIQPKDKDGEPKPAQKPSEKASASTRSNGNTPEPPVQENPSPLMDSADRSQIFHPQVLANMR